MRRPSAKDFHKIVIYDPVFPFFWLFIPSQEVTTYRRFWPAIYSIWVRNNPQNSHRKKLCMGRRRDTKIAGSTDFVTLTIVLHPCPRHPRALHRPLLGRVNRNIIIGYTAPFNFFCVVFFFLASSSALSWCHHFSGIISSFIVASHSPIIY